MILFLTVLALCASTWRATRLLVKDDLPLVRRPREAIVRRTTRPDGELRWQGELITCSWCVSVYVSAALTLATDLVVGLPVPVLMFGLAAAFAASYEHLTTRGRDCPEVNAQQLIIDALEQPEWRVYAQHRINDGGAPRTHLPGSRTESIT